MKEFCGNFTKRLVYRLLRMSSEMAKGLFRIVTEDSQSLLHHSMLLKRRQSTIQVTRRGQNLHVRPI